MIKFEVVSKFENDSVDLIPTRKTAQSAGYDFVVAEDITIPAYQDLCKKMLDEYYIKNVNFSPVNTSTAGSCSLNETKEIVSAAGAKPTLVSTGVKCQLEPDTYLELSLRSSTPLKYWIVMANSVGIIDADYYNNPDNEGEIFFQLINFAPWPITLKKGDRIGQGIIKKYETITKDNATGSRTGGFGSTGK